MGTWRSGTVAVVTPEAVLEEVLSVPVDEEDEPPQAARAATAISAPTVPIARRGMVSTSW
jgi:hypothetical protein